VYSVFTQAAVHWK